MTAILWRSAALAYYNFRCILRQIEAQHPARRNAIHNPIFYAQSDSVNNLTSGQVHLTVYIYFAVFVCDYLLARAVGWQRLRKRKRRGGVAICLLLLTRGGGVQK